MNRNQWKMMIFQSHLLRITVQNFLHQRVIRPATRTLIVTELHQCYRSVRRPPKMTASLDIHVRGSGGSVCGLVRLPAQVNGGAGSHRYRNDDDDKGFKQFRHATHSSSLGNFCEKYIASRD